MLQIMIQRGQLCAGGIAAARGNRYRKPSPFPYRWGLCCVTHQIMVQCGQLFAGGIVSRSGRRGRKLSQADFRTGGGFCTGCTRAWLSGSFSPCSAHHTLQTALAVQVAVPPVQLAVLTSEQRVQLPVCVPLPLGVRPMRDRRSNSLHKYCTFPDWCSPRSRRCSFQSLLRYGACICGCACACRRRHPTVVTENAVFRAA